MRQTNRGCATETPVAYEMTGSTEPYIYRFSDIRWGALVLLAQRYGWKPAGTVLYRHNTAKPLDQGWKGSYFAHIGQIVTRKDAAQLAHAIEQALDDIPDFVTPNKDR